MFSTAPSLVATAAGSARGASLMSNDALWIGAYETEHHDEIW